jgi:hypothetical protein
LANYNKTRLNTGRQHDVGWNWRKRWEFKLILKCKHQCHCACSSEIGSCIINNAGRQAAHTKKPNENTHFLVESRQTMFYTHILKAYINFQRKKKLSKKWPNLHALTLPLNIMTFCYVYLLYILLVSFQLSISCQSEDINHTFRNYYLD